MYRGRCISILKNEVKCNDYIKGQGNQRLGTVVYYISPDDWDNAKYLFVDESDQFKVTQMTHIEKTNVLVKGKLEETKTPKIDIQAHETKDFCFISKLE